MSFYDPNDRYRRRSARRMLNFISAVFALGVLFCFGFWVGGLRAQQDVFVLREENRILDEERTTLQADITALRAQSQTSSVRFEQLKASYDALLDGPLKKLTGLLKEQIDSGVDVERLETVILLARPPQNCVDPQTRRFAVITPVYKGADNSITIAKGQIRISAKGDSAVNNKGKKEAWFDPNKSVDVMFRDKTGTTKTKSGVLPIQHSMISNGKEYRFSISAGEKSFARVTYDFCDYP